MSQQPPELSRDISLRAAFFSFEGRISRRRYWEYSLLANAGLLAAIFTISILFFQVSDSVRKGGLPQTNAPILFIGVTLSLYAITVWIGLALQIKRLHDRGRTGWFSLLNVIPVIGPALLTIDTYFRFGDMKANRFGPAPRPCLRSTGLEAGLILSGIGVLLALAIAGRTLIMEPFNIPSGSGEPVIVNGDYLSVSRYAYRLHEPARGDIAVFIDPHSGEDYIKRIVGLPGDTVQVNHGIVSINGQTAERTRIADYHERVWYENYQRDQDNVRYRYIETLPGGQSHEILGGPVKFPEDSLPQDNTGRFTVPPGRFFAMGDNRDNSNDSRLGLGYVPLTNLVGRAEFCYFSRAPGVPFWKVMVDFASGIRWDRVLRVIV
jgi:signal peptidase I